MFWGKWMWPAERPPRVSYRLHITILPYQYIANYTYVFILCTEGKRVPRFDIIGRMKIHISFEIVVHIQLRFNMAELLVLSWENNLRSILYYCRFATPISKCHLVCYITLHFSILWHFCMETICSGQVCKVFLAQCLHHFKIIGRFICI